MPVCGLPGTESDIDLHRYASRPESALKTVLSHLDTSACSLIRSAVDVPSGVG